MKKFSKLLAVVVAIAVVVCPMMSIVSSATSTGGYKIEALDENNFKLTISSTGGFIAYQASVEFNDASAFQSTYSSDGYTDGVKLIDYTTKTAAKDSYNTPTIYANATGSALNIVVMPTDSGNLDLLTEVVIGLRVAAGSTASLTKIQAADDGADVNADPTLLSFPAADANTGAINPEAEDYDASKAETTSHVHTIVEDAAVAPTCTETGLTAGSHCSVCNEVLVAQEVVDATGHTVVQDAAVAPTCTETGLTAGSHCSVCNTVLVAQEVVPATGHTVVQDAAVAPTCTETGLTAGSHCSVCNAVILAQEVVSANGHTPVTDEAVAPTCTETGLTEGSHCSVCNAVILAQEVVAATGHTVVQDAAVAPTCTETGLTAGSHCSVCNTVLVAQEIVAATGHTFTYTENGDGTHTVGCENCDYSAQEACDTEGDEGACSKCGYKEVTGPIEDGTLVVAGASTGLGADAIKVTFRVSQSVWNKYAKTKLVVIADKYDSNYNRIETPVETVYDASMMTTAGKFFTRIYNDFQLYALDLSFTYQLKGYDAEDNLVAVGPATTTTIASLLKALYASSSDAKLKTMITDILIVGQTAKDYFAPEGSDCANTVSLLSGFDTSYATTAVGELNTVDTITTLNGSTFGGATTYANRIAKSVAIGKVPAINFRITDKTQAMDLDSLVMTITYYDALNKRDVVTVIKGSSTSEAEDKGDIVWSRVSNNITARFENVGLASGNADLNVLVTFNGTEVASMTYAIESYLNANLSNATTGAITTALAKLGASARTYFLS